MISSIKYTE